jgi:hypothetical protein
MIDGCQVVGYRRRAGECPEVGQHIELTLLDLGHTWEEIAVLKEQGAIT